MDAAAAVLTRVPLFAELDGPDVATLAEAFKEHTFPEGSSVTVEDERGPRVLAFFVIAEGTATVSKGGRRLATLGPSDYFGEVALFLDVPRMATVKADTDLRCLALSSWEFRPFLEEHSSIAWRLLETMARRLYEASS